MATGFKVGNTDIEDILVKKSDFTGSKLKAMVEAAGTTGNLNVEKIGGKTASYIRCSNGCSWNCSKYCDTASKRKM